MRTNKLVLVVALAGLVVFSGLALWAQEQAPTAPTAGEVKPRPAPAPVAKPLTPTPPPRPGDPKAQPAPAPVDPEKAPKAVVAQLEYDAGVVTKGTTIKHDFVVENQGKGPLEITRVQPACGCTLSEYDKTIEVGKKGKITLSVNTTNFRGPINKSTSVATNDPSLASFQLIMKAEIKEIIAILPSDNMQLGLIYKGQKQEKEFSLKSTDDVAFNVTQIESTDPALKYDLKMAPDGKSATLKVIVPEDHAVGPVTGRFTLNTTHPKVPTLSINTFGTIREPLTVYPQEIVYAGLSKDFIEKNPTDNSLTKPITIAFETASDLEVKSVKSSLPFLKTTLEMLEGQAPAAAAEPGKEPAKVAEPVKVEAGQAMIGKRFSVKVKLDSSAPVGDFNGTITIDTNKKTLTIPVRGKVF